MEYFIFGIVFFLPIGLIVAFEFFDRPYCPVGGSSDSPYEILCKYIFYKVNERDDTCTIQNYRWDFERIKLLEIGRPLFIEMKRKVQYLEKRF